MDFMAKATIALNFFFYLKHEHIILSFLKKRIAYMRFLGREQFSV